VVIDDADGSSLTVGAVDNASVGTYSVEVSNSYGWAETSMTLSLQSFLSIVTQPSDVIIDIGQSISLTVVSTGSDPMTYQWYLGESGDTNVPVTFGINGPMLPLLLPQAWSRYWVRVTMGNTHVDSRTALVRVNGGTMTLADWTLLAGTPANQRGALDTPADDGVCNLMKFALGVAPMDSVVARLPRAVIVAGQGADRHLAVEFTRNTLARGIEFDLELSTDLKTWKVEPSTSAVIGAEGVGLEKVILRETAPLDGSPRRFVRLAVRVAP